MRLKILGNELVRLQPEIICIQEIWMKGARDCLANRLREYGYNQYQPKPDWRFSGFLTLIRGKISQTKAVNLKPIIYTNDFSLIEFLGYKGFALTETSLLGEERLWVFNLHLAAGWNTKYSKGMDCDCNTLREIESLSKEINRLGHEKIIVVGDYNFVPDCCSYQQLVKSTGLIDIVPREFHTSQRSLFRIPLPNKPERLDHVFIKNLSSSSKIKIQVVWNHLIEGIQLSDHAGLLAEIDQGD